VASIETLRDRIAANLATITGLRTSSTIPDNPNPPVAIVQLNRVQYHQDFQRGMTEYNFAVQVIVGRVDERSAQDNLDAYCSSTGSSSIILAIESDRRLQNNAFDCIVTEMTNYGSVLISDVTYLAAEFNVRVLAS
jgi:hypothetical protein